MRRTADWLERHQVALCVAVVAAAAVAGVSAPRASAALAHAVTPSLIALLYATFLTVPFGRLWRVLADGRFLLALGIVNFVLVPMVVYGLTRFVASDRQLLVGVLLVLLCPCVDYVIVFAGLAGGARERLLAATPFLLLGQLALLPLYLLLFGGAAIAGDLDPEPFVTALVLFVLVPALLAALTQAASRRWRVARVLRDAIIGSMVPLLLLTLATVTASQLAKGIAPPAAILAVVPLYAGFILAAVLVGLAVGRLLRLDAPRGVAVTFSGVTRNSLVVLPLALALPAGYGLVPLLIVTQTVVELIAMPALVAGFTAAGKSGLLHRLLPPAPRPTGADATPSAGRSTPEPD